MQTRRSRCCWRHIPDSSPCHHSPMPPQLTPALSSQEDVHYQQMQHPIAAHPHQRRCCCLQHAPVPRPECPHARVVAVAAAAQRSANGSSSHGLRHAAVLPAGNARSTRHLARVAARPPSPLLHFRAAGAQERWQTPPFRVHTAPQRSAAGRPKEGDPAPQHCRHSAASSGALSLPAALRAVGEPR